MLKQKYGEYALITGASSGIGKEFAIQLAKEGFNLVLVARRKELLEVLAQELQGKFGINVIVIDADLTKENVIEEIDSFIKKIDLGMVVLNAGIQMHGNFLKSSLIEQEKMLDLNINVPMKMAHIFANRFVKKQKGALIFLASTFAYQPVPYFSSYAASKPYILSFADALRVELSPKGVDVLSLSPGLTKTEMVEKIAIDFSKMPIVAMETKEVVYAALNALKKKKNSVIPGVRNKIMAFFSQRVMPRALTANVFGDMNAKAMDPSVL